MKTGNLLLIAGGAVLLYYWGNLGVAANTIQVNFKGIRILSFSDFEITLTVQNVSNVPINVNSMSGNVFINGQQLASIGDFEKVIVPGNSYADIVVHASPSVLSLPSVIKNLANGTGGTYTFSVVGNVNVNGLVLPFSLDQNVSF